MCNLTPFEMWQVVNMTAQSVLLLATFLGALYVGVKQYQINKQLVELQHQPSVEVATTEDQLRIHNKGGNSIWLWGSHVDHSLKLIENEPRLITPQGFYYIPLAMLKSGVLSLIGQTGEERLTLTLYITTADKRKYVIRNVLLCVATAGQVAVHSQTVGIEHKEWSSSDAAP